MPRLGCLFAFLHPVEIQDFPRLVRSRGRSGFSRGRWSAPTSQRERNVPKVMLKNGKSLEVPPGYTIAQALAAGGVPVGPDILAANVNGRSTDLSAPLTVDATLDPLRFDTAEGREIYRHSSTHHGASRERTFPPAQLTIGPALEDSFYYDFRLRSAVHARRPREHRATRS